MIWSIWANQFQELPELVKAKMWVYLQRHGADPTRMRGFTFDADNQGIWVEYVEVNSVNIAHMDITGSPRLVSEWIVLEDIKGKDRPDFLEWMTPGENPPKSLGDPATNTTQPKVHLKDSEWGSGRDGYL
jgi:hypothetical protein